MPDLGFATVGAITVICLLVAQGIKATKLDAKWVPVIVGALGALLGIVCMYHMPDFPAYDPITAIAVGIVSGGGSTWLHQIYKQLFDTNAQQ